MNEEEENLNRLIVPKILDVSWATILRIAVALASLYLLYLIRDILIWFVFALVISILLNPLIEGLKRIHFPRTIAAILVYFGIGLVFGYLIYQMAPFLSIELSQFSAHFPSYFDKLSPYLSGLKIEALKNFNNFSIAVERVLMKASTNIFSALGTVFGGIMSTFAIFSIAFFLSLEEKGVERVLALVSPSRHRDRVLRIWERSKRKIAGWFAVRLIGMTFVGLFTFVTCYVLNVKYSVFFGLFAGLSDIIVTLGPLFSGIIITIFILLTSVPKAIIFVLAFFLIQGIEGHILIPVLSKKFLRLPPALVLMALLIGGKLWGILGAILAHPFTGILFEFTKEFFSKRRDGLQQTYKQ